MEYWLPLLGFVVGVLGTLIGAGGGFILGPLLLFLYPHEAPAALTSISLAVALGNSASGSIAYARQRRIDYRTALIFAAATVPTAIVGVYAVRFIPKTAFAVVFGVVLLALAALLLSRPGGRVRFRPRRPGDVQRTLRDRYGDTYRWSFPLAPGVALSIAIGFLSSVLGIGGGAFHVPAMVLLLGFPIHIATATSQFILLFTALVGTLTHLAAGDFATVWQRTLLLGGGAVLGAQVGGAIARRTRPVIITRVLVGALILIGVRLLLRPFIG